MQVTQPQLPEVQEPIAEKEVNEPSSDDLTANGSVQYDLVEAAKQLLSLSSGRELFRKIAVKIRNEFPMGETKTMAQWAKAFKITISEDPTPDEIRQKLIEVGKLYQIAADFLRTSKGTLKTTQLDYDSGISAEIRRLVNVFRGAEKRPAREIIEAMAEANCLILASSLANAQIVADFWQDVVWELKTFVEILDIAQRTYFSSAKLEAMQPNNLPRG